MREFLEQMLVSLRKNPRGIILSVVVFFVVYWTRGFTEGILGGALTLAIVAKLESRLFLLWALVSIATIPVFYVADRPAQAERVGVLAFSLLALGIVTTLVETWRARR